LQGRRPPRLAVLRFAELVNHPAARSLALARRRGLAAPSGAASAKAEELPDKGASGRYETFKRGKAPLRRVARNFGRVRFYSGLFVFVRAVLVGRGSVDLLPR
jgi:hypothetical protein